MSARILLVTGSRALEGSPFADRARALLSSALRGLPDRSIVVAGDARGPDAWAAELATSGHLTLALRVYSLDGWVYDERLARLRQWNDGPASSPIARNVAMVAETAAQRAKGWGVEAFGLEARWSDTQGTAHTLATARGAGLEITRITFERSK